MIRVSRLTPDDIGRIVVYTSPHGCQHHGKLSSWNSLYVFVQFNGPNGEACLPSQVSFVSYGDKPKPPTQEPMT